MHIPDGFLDVRTCAGSYCLAGAGLAWAFRQAKARWNDRTVPLLGVIAAFIFAGQTINIPVGFGTSGHLFGGTLAAIFLGPSGAALAITAVLSVQALVFQDGGVTTLGANALNMALIIPFVGYWTYRLLLRAFGTAAAPERPAIQAGGGGPLPAASRAAGRRRAVAAALASWTSLLLSASACAWELSLSGMAPFKITATTLVSIHAIIGVLEAALTAGMVATIARVRPDLFYEPRGRAPGNLESGWPSWAGTMAALCGALLLTPLSSKLPDGLEKAAAALGFSAKEHPILSTALERYQTPGVSTPWFSTALAATVGAGLAALAAWVISRLLRRSAPPRTHVE